MTFYQILKFALVVNLCWGDQLPAQSSQNNVAAVKNIYEAIQNKDTSTLIPELVPKMKGYDPNFDSNAFDRYHITFPAILQNYWQQVTVIDLQIEEMEVNVILAKGEFTGRQSTDCEIVTTIFQHIWSLKDGNVIEFKE